MHIPCPLMFQQLELSHASTAREAGRVLLGAVSFGVESSLSQAPGRDLPPPSGMAPSRQRCPQEQVRDNMAMHPCNWRSSLTCHRAGLIHNPNLFSSGLPLNSADLLSEAGQTKGWPCLYLLLLQWLHCQVGSESSFGSTVCTGCIFGGEPDDVPGTFHFYGQRVGAILQHHSVSCLVLCRSRGLAWSSQLLLNLGTYFYSYQLLDAFPAYSTAPAPSNQHELL